MPKAHTLKDNFATESSAKWTGFGGSISVSGGQLRLQPDNIYSAIFSQEMYDMTESYAMIELVQAPPVGNGTIESGLTMQVSPGNTESFLVAGTQLRMRETVSNSHDDTVVAYDPVEHRWLRIRESGGTVYWETSPDSLNWTAQRNKTSTHANLTQLTIVIYAGYWGSEPTPGMAIVDNLNISVPPQALAEGWVTGRLPLGGGYDTGTVEARTYFDTADWLWSPIRDDPALDPDSAAIVSLLASTTAGASRVANMHAYGVTLRGPGGIDISTPRHDIVFANEGVWGSDPFDNDTVGVPDDMPIPPGSDGHVAIADPTTNQVYSLWRATNTGGVWGAEWGAKVDLHGDGLETTGSSTGARLSRYAGVIRASEIAAGEIPHALFFSTDMAHASEFRYPATNSDGNNMAGVDYPIPEGARIQLDPSIDVAAIPGITPGEIAVAKALQQYGAYCGDNGGARMGFIFEYQDDSDPGQVYVDAGLAWDYFDMAHIPWESLRVLRTWDGEPEATLLWETNFTSSGETAESWQTQTGRWGASSGEQQYYTEGEANAVLNSGDGTMEITARNENPPDNATTPNNYTSARLTTMGLKSVEPPVRVVARIRMPITKGLLPAFWMVGLEPGHEYDWPRQGEVDIVEYPGFSNTPSTQWTGNIHGPSQADNTVDVKFDDVNADIGQDLTADFHEYGIDWYPNRMVWHVDGVEVATKTQSQYQARGGDWTPFSGAWPHYLILNVAVGNNWTGQTDGSSVFPQAMVVDWIRVWSLG